MGWGERTRAAVMVFGGLILGLLVLELAIHGWRGLPSHEGAHDSRAQPASSTQNAATSREAPSSTESATGHMPPWHHGLIHGTNRDDVIYGTESGERIEALAGRDRIIARGGNDELDGGPDADVLMGGAGDDTYIIQHHGGGADVILEESGTDTLRLVGGHIDRASIEILRHGDDLLVRWAPDRPGDAVLIRSWYAGTQYHVERLELPDGTIVPLEPLAARARTATTEDMIHFPPSPVSGKPGPPAPANQQ